MELWNFNGQQNKITDALKVNLPEHAVISVTGAGGKTSLIFAWARELAASGKKVAITTTTHMAEVKQGTVLCFTSVIYDSDDPQSTCSTAKKELDNGRIIFVGARDNENPGKIKSPSAPVLEYICKTADVTLIEADGSRRMPLKWPAPWEPVVPDNTDITVCVCGLSAVGKSTSDVVYRADKLPDNLKKETVDVNFLHKLIASRDGGRKCALGEFRVFLNQVDDDTDRLAAAYRLQQILSVLGIPVAWGSLCESQEKPGNNDRGNETVGSMPLSSSHLDDQPLTIALILEAAGNSSRFGSNKLLHIMDDGRPMASFIMDSVCEASDIINRPPAERIRFKKILVTQYEEVAELAPDFETVFNNRPDLGISHSMQLGIEAAGAVDAYMFCVCDQPWLKSDTICRLIEEYQNGTAGIVSLAWQGRMCNPKIFSSKYKSELMSLSGDTGGRQIIADHKDELLLVEASNEAETIDIDEI